MTSPFPFQKEDDRFSISVEKFGGIKNRVPWNKSSAVPLADLRGTVSGFLRKGSSPIPRTMELNPAVSLLIKSQADFDLFVNEKRFSPHVTKRKIKVTMDFIAQQDGNIAQQSILRKLIREASRNTFGKKAK